jgi:hypothetical protein
MKTPKWGELDRGTGLVPPFSRPRVNPCRASSGARLRRCNSRIKRKPGVYLAVQLISNAAPEVRPGR